MKHNLLVFISSVVFIVLGLKSPEYPGFTQKSGLKKRDTFSMTWLVREEPLLTA